MQKPLQWMLLVVSVLLIGCQTDKSQHKNDEKVSTNKERVSNQDRKQKTTTSTPDPDKTTPSPSQTSENKDEASNLDKEELKACVEECLEQRQKQSKPYAQIRSECEQECAGIED